jgi:hypothetical protein
MVGTFDAVDARVLDANGARSAAQGSPGCGSTGHGAFLAAGAGAPLEAPLDAPLDATSAADVGVAWAGEGARSSDRSIEALHARASSSVPAGPPRTTTAAAAPNAMPRTNQSARRGRRRLAGCVTSRWGAARAARDGRTASWSPRC